VVIYQVLQLRAANSHGVPSPKSQWYQHSHQSHVLIRSWKKNKKIPHDFYSWPTLNSSPKPHLQKMLPCEHPYHTWDLGLGTWDLKPRVKQCPVFSVMAAGWFCEKSGWIGKVEDVKLVLFKRKKEKRKKRISTGNHFEEEDFYSDWLWNRRISFNLIHLGPNIIWF